MQNNLPSLPPRTDSAARRDGRFSTPLFARPSTNRVAARARLAAAGIDDLWTPGLLQRLQSPLTRLRD